MTSKTLLAAALGAAMAASLLVSTLASAQGQDPTQVTLGLNEFKISMSASTVPAGVPITFTATNAGSLAHEVVLEPVGADDQALMIDGKPAEIEDVGPGESKSATWTITRPGTYQLACHVPGHYEHGMVTTFVVTGDAAAGQAQPMSPMQPEMTSPEMQSAYPTATAAVTATPEATPDGLPFVVSAAGAAGPWWPAAALPVLGSIGFVAWRMTVAWRRDSGDPDR